MRSLLVTGLLVSLNCLAGSPEEDIISYNYQQRFRFASPAKISQFFQRSQRTEGLWEACHVRITKLGVDASGVLPLQFTRQSKDVLLLEDFGEFSTDRDGELRSYNPYDLDHARNHCGVSATGNVTTKRITTLRVDAAGSILGEISYVATPSATLEGCWESPAVGTLETEYPSQLPKVVNYFVCEATAGTRVAE